MILITLLSYLISPQHIYYFFLVISNLWGDSLDHWNILLLVKHVLLDLESIGDSCLYQSSLLSINFVIYLLMI